MADIKDIDILIDKIKQNPDNIDNYRDLIYMLQIMNLTVL